MTTDDLKAKTWQIDKNVSISVLVTVILSAVYLIVWAVDIKHQVSTLVLEVRHVQDNLGGHEAAPAHGEVLPRLSSIDTRLENIEQWMRRGERFTKEDGEDLDRRLRDLEARSNAIRPDYMIDGRNP